MPENNINNKNQDNKEIGNHPHIAQDRKAEKSPNSNTNKSNIGNNKQGNIQNIASKALNKTPTGQAINLANKLKNNNKAPINPKTNVGKNTLNNNPNIAQTMNMLKQQNNETNSIKQQLEKNAIRYAANVFAPGAGNLIGQAASEINQKKQEATSNGTEEGTNEEKQDTDYNGTRFNIKGAFSLKKVKIATFIILCFSFILIMMTPAIASSRFKHLVGIGSGGTEADPEGAAAGDKELENLYYNINDIQKEYSENGKKFTGDLVAAVYHVLSTHVNEFGPEDMTNSLIREIADNMFKASCDNNNENCTYGYDESILREYLKNDLFPRYLQNNGRDDLVDEVFTYISDFQKVVGKNKGIIGSCIINGNTQANDINFASMSEDEIFELFGPIANQVYAETGIFASVTLAQGWIEANLGKGGTPKNSNNVLGMKCAYPSGQNKVWPPSTWDNKCTAPTTTQEDYDRNGQLTTIKASFRIYKNIEECFLDSRSMIASSPIYTSHNVLGARTPEEQIDRIIAAGYGNAANYENTIKGIINRHNLKKWDTMSTGTCTNSTGEYTTWKQGDSKWGSIRLGNSSNTISKAGCLVTSISMLIKKFNISTNVKGEFNPGTFVQALNANGGFAAGGNLNWEAVSRVAPTFRKVSDIKVSGKSQNEKLFIIKENLNKGYAIVVEVKGSTGQHWVAVNSINGSTVNMMDPASSATDMWKQYNPNNTSRIVCYKIG